MEASMGEIRDWKAMWAMSGRLLRERTGDDVDTWNSRVQAQGFQDEKALREWLTGQGVTGYAQTLLVMERFGYPSFFLASGSELIDAQYSDRSHLRPVFDTIIDAVAALGEVTIQARKTYVSLVTPRRTFARVVPATKDRVAIGLRLEGQRPEGCLVPSKIHETMPVQIGLSSPEDVDFRGPGVAPTGL